VELPFELEMEKLNQKYPFEGDNDLCWAEELNEAVLEGVSDLAEEFMDELCKDANCGNIS
jgi:hypothetical protein